MTNKLVSVYLCVAMAFVPILVHAESILSEGNIVILKKGEIAPYDGTLMDKTAVSKILAMREEDKKQCELDKQLALDKQKAMSDLVTGNLKADLELEKKKATLDNSYRDAEIKRLTETAKDLDNSSSIKWWCAGSFAVGILVTLGTFFVVSKITQTQVK